MRKNVALTLTIAGGFLLLFNAYELICFENGGTAWIRVASNICIILVGAIALKNIKT